MKKVNAKLLTRIRSQNNTNNLVMSFMKISDQNEIDLIPINVILAKRGCLVLPRVNIETNELEIYKVHDLNTLVKDPTFNIPEPTPKLHQLVDPGDLHTIFVPGLSFDCENNRLGRGKGFYDRFLIKVPKSTAKIGVAFIEQYCANLLPTSEHDQKVDEVIYSN